MKHLSDGVVPVEASHALAEIHPGTPMASWMAYPKVLRSTADRTTLFYHVHIPKTGGTAVAHLLASDICAPFDNLLTLSGWKSACNVTCELGLTDNEFACNDLKRNAVEHNAFNVNVKRAEDLKARFGAKKVVYVTTLRRGSDRVVSQWKAEVDSYGSFVPPEGVDKFSMKSLQHYIQGLPHQGKGWVADNDPTLRNNLQVGMLSSRLRWDVKLPVRQMDLDVAKKALMTGDWIIGFSDCMPQLQEKILEHTAIIHGGYTRKDVPFDNKATSDIVIDEETQKMLDEHSHLDNELYAWAWNLAANKSDTRFTNTC